MTQYLTKKKKSKERGVCLGSKFESLVHCGRKRRDERMGGSWSHCICNQGEKDELPNFVVFIQSGTTAHGIMLPTFKVDLPTSDKPIWKLAHRHMQSCVS